MPKPSTVLVKCKITCISSNTDLAGANCSENAEISSIVEGVDEVWIRLITHFFETDEAVKVNIDNYQEIVCKKKTPQYHNHSL